MSDSRMSNKMKVVQVFQYRGLNIVVRCWDDYIYEYLFSIGGEIYCDYIEAQFSNQGTTKKRKLEDEQLANQVMSDLSMAACTNADYHLKGRWKRKIINQFKYLKNYVTAKGNVALKQKESATEPSRREVKV